MHPLIDPLLTDTCSSDLRKWFEELLPNIGSVMDPSTNGHIPKWEAALASLPSLTSSTPDLLHSVVSDGSSEELDPGILEAFHPWRKGPYQLGSVFLNTEWRSDLKWQRLFSALDPLEGRRCLDVGCGNGYHLWRMLGAGADLAVGLDPFLLYVYQFLAIAKRIPRSGISVLPLGAEAIQPGLGFDTTFSMGVLYHASDPSSHLSLLRESLRDGGQLLLETLTVPEDVGPLFDPQGRYAQMRNVSPLPTVDHLLGWVTQAGFHNATWIDTTVTTFEEQRPTEWMTFHSLPQFLDPEDPTRTIEGHPAPQRTILTAWR